MFALIELPPAFDFTDVEAIIEDVRERRPMESRLARTVAVPFKEELVGQTFKRESARGVQFKDADDRL